MPRTSFGIEGKDIKAISDNSCKFKILSNKQVIKYINNCKFKIPEIQREIEQDKVDDIITCFKNKHKKNDNYFIHHGFTLSLCIINNNFSEFWVIDGQHRLEAIKRLNDYEFNIIIRIKLCNNLDDMKEDFKLLNINSNIPIQYTYFENKFLSTTIINIKNQLKCNFSNSFNRNKNSKSKIYHMNEFIKLFDIEKLKNLYNSNNIDFGNHEFIYNKLIDINNIIKRFFDNLVLSNTLHYYINKRSYSKIIKDNFYLSLKNINWIDKLYDSNNNILYNTINYKKKKIPKNIRRKLFDTYFDNKYEGVCYVCNSIINRDNFHAGHIIAEHLGGSNNINNLKCICSQCNLSMGTQNLEDYKIKYF